MASPIAASAAATVRTKSAKTWPTISPRWVENATRLMFTASRMSSIDIRMTITFFRLRKMPSTPSVNRMAATVRKWPSPIVIASNSEALAGGYLVHLHGLFGCPGHLLGNILAPDADPLPERQHDRAQHGDEEDQAGRLEEVGILRVQHPPDRLGIGDGFGGGRCRNRNAQSLGAHHPPGDDEHQLDEE